MATATANGHRLVSFAELIELPPPHEDVPLPELGVEVRLYAISGQERARLGALANSLADEPQSEMDFTCQVIAASLEAGVAEDVAKLPALVINRLMRVAFRLAGIGERAIDEAAAALKTTPSADSGSA